MIGMAVSKAKKEAAEDILSGDFSKSGFFLKVDDQFETEGEKKAALVDRAKAFLDK